MKIIFTIAAAATLLAGCAHQSPAGGERLAEEDEAVSIGSNIKRKKSAGGSASSTVSAAEVEHDRMSSSR